MLEQMSLHDALERYANEHRKPEPPEPVQRGFVTTLRAVDGVIIASPDALLALRPASAFASVSEVAPAERGRLARCEVIDHDSTW